jgi:hypothetical protein
VVNVSDKSFTEFEEKSLEKLSQIIERLNLLLVLSVPPFNIEGLKLGPVEKEVLRLCDLSHTKGEMAIALGKKSSHISKTLTGLKNRGLVKYVKIGNETYYLRVIR